MRLGKGSGKKRKWQDGFKLGKNSLNHDSWLVDPSSTYDRNKASKLRKATRLLLNRGAELERAHSSEDNSVSSKMTVGSTVEDGAHPMSYDCRCDSCFASRSAGFIAKSLEKETSEIQKEAEEKLGMPVEIKLDPATLRWVHRGSNSPSKLLLNGKAVVGDNQLELDVQVVHTKEDNIYRWDLVPTPGIWRMSEERINKDVPPIVIPASKEVSFEWEERKGNWLRGSKVVPVENGDQLKSIIDSLALK